ncbi:MAG: hypothetical protein IKR98_04750 [Bacteroidaceae bacterium]|nr:hypothetical protein [Bacteroidaceae bacterium]
MKTNEVNNENVQGMFLCWTQVSRRMQKTMNEAEYDLLTWMLDNLVHRVTTDFEATVYNVGRQVDEANKRRIDPETEPELLLEYSEPDELTSGFIRVERSGEPKAVINIPVIDWRGTAPGSEEWERE